MRVAAGNKKTAARRTSIKVRPTADRRPRAVAQPSRTSPLTHLENRGAAPVMIDGAAIRQARKDAGLSQVELARAIGATQQCIACIEIGRTKSTRLLPRIANVLRRQLGELFNQDWVAVEEGEKRPAASSPDTTRLGDYAFFAREILRIRTKTGAIESFVFNRAQQYVHEKLEAQLASLGRVRALILKGRQQGCSTYIGGRYYHR